MISVWTFDNTFCGWVKRQTNGVLGTKDEYNFFRVMRDGYKEFYMNEVDHFYHMTENLKPVKRLYVWKKSLEGTWTKSPTDLTTGTRDTDGFYTVNTGKNKQYYYSYMDYINHQRDSGGNTFYKN